jgi:hypothetical protein
MEPTSSYSLRSSSVRASAGRIERERAAAERAAEKAAEKAEKRGRSLEKSGEKVDERNKVNIVLCLFQTQAHIEPP